MKSLKLLITVFFAMALTSCGGPDYAEIPKIKRHVFDECYNCYQYIRDEFIAQIESGDRVIEGFGDDGLSEACIRYLKDNFRVRAKENRYKDLDEWTEYYKGWKSRRYPDWGRRYYRGDGPLRYEYSGYGYSNYTLVEFTENDLDKIEELLEGGKLHSFEDLRALLETRYHMKDPNQDEAYEFNSGFAPHYIGWSFLSKIIEYSPLYQNPERAKFVLGNLFDEFDAYIEKRAQEEVSVINWDYDEDALGDTYTGYLVEYEVGDGVAYVLLRLIEYDEKNRYEGQVIYSGSSLIEMREYYE
ncbi:MAG: hypothetical protein K2O01_02695 [Bacteroidales bacterium]|nr:hypothetical protein [Bacteroidales bacterium]